MVLEADEELLSSMESSAHELVDLRSLMPVLPMEELAVAGHAVALSNWHKVHMAIRPHSTTYPSIPCLHACRQIIQSNYQAGHRKVNAA